MSEGKFTHLDETGSISMVDVGRKATTEREAVAAATVRMSKETLAKLLDRAIPKGDVLTTVIFHSSGDCVAQRRDIPSPVVVQQHRIEPGLAQRQSEFEVGVVHRTQRDDS